MLADNNVEALMGSGRRIARYLALVMGVLAAFAVAPGMAEAQIAPPGITSFTFAPNPAHSGDAVGLKVTVSRGVDNSYYDIRITNRDTGAVVAWCWYGSECGHSFVTGWTSLADRHYIASVVDARSGTPMSSATLTVPVHPYDFGLTFTQTPTPAHSGDIVSVKAAINRDVSNTGLAINIYDTDTGSVVKSCASGTSCGYSYAAGWRNHDLRTRSFEARVENATSVHHRASLAVPIHPYDQVCD